MIDKLRCHRCKEATPSTMMSRFNTEMICMDCDDKERAHPMYAEAAAKELAAVKRGEMNFPGIGKPEDL